MNRWLLWVPLVVFGALLALALNGLLRPTSSIVASRMIGKPLPVFVLAPALPGKPGLSSAAFGRGQPRLINIFASWCVPCAAEAPQLAKLKAAGATIDAVAIRDTPAALRRFLDRYGDPFTAIGADPQNTIQLSLGSSGVPETFVIDGNGRIAAQHIGMITANDVPKLLADLEQAR